MKIKKIVSFSLFSILAIGATSCFHGTDTNANIDDYFNPTTGEITIPEGETVNIDFWTWGSASTEAIYTNICKKFEAQYPNIKIKYTCTPSSTYLTKLANSANDLPDAFFVPDTDFYYYAYSDVLWNFRPYVLDKEIEDVWPDAINRYYYDHETNLVGETDTSGLYAIPKDISCFQLAYNENLLKTVCTESSLDWKTVQRTYLDDQKPITWEKFKELGNLVNPYCRTKNLYFLSSYQLYAALYSNNADFTTDDGSASRVMEPQFIDALDFIHSLGFGPDKKDNTGLMAGGSGTATDTGYSSFVGQNSIFSWVGPWDCETFWGVTPAAPQALEFTVKMLPTPYGPGADRVYGTDDDGVSSCQIGSAGYCISGKTSTTNIQRAAALKFLKWMSLTQDTQRDLYKSGSMLPLLKSLKDEYIEFGNGQVTQYAGGKVDCNPSNLNVFIDVVDGYSATDRVTGRAKTETRTLGNEWKKDWPTVVDEIGFWKNADATGLELVTAYKPIIDQWLAQYNAQIGR